MHAKMNRSIKIKKLDIQESYFVGQGQLKSREYKINIQREGRLGKAILLPFKLDPPKKILVRISGPDKFIENYLSYGGKSEWIEIDSNEITDYLADNQDQFDYLDIITNPEE